MDIGFLVLGGYGLYVWPAFIITFTICLYFYLRTKAELNLQEKNYLIEFKHFENKTGVPALINTSFNESEPIVDTPKQALETFKRTNMDILVMGNYVVE